MKIELDRFLVESGKENMVQIHMTDIEDDEILYEEFREYIPVLLVNGAEVCHYFLDTQELAESISQIRLT